MKSKSNWASQQKNDNSEDEDGESGAGFMNSIPAVTAAQAG